MIYLIKLSEIEKHFYQLFDLVGNKRKEQIKKDKAQVSKICHLVSGLLYRFALGNNYEELIKINEHGKPCTENGISFNASHSGNYAVLYIGENECGVDIEKIEEKRISLSSKVFTDEELAWIGNDAEKFFHAWTRKESISKAIGMGFFYSFKNIDVLNDCFVFDDKKRFFTSTTSFDNHIISVSEENKYPDIKIKELEIYDILC